MWYLYLVRKIMMTKLHYVILFFVLFSCGKNPEDHRHSDAASASSDSTNHLENAGMYANETFKDVTVKKTGDHEFKIRGKGQIYETAFNWVVEDGHRELKKGYVAPDEGAPAWGKFVFTIDVEKEDPNTTLHLILFEPSPKNMSRKHKLSIPLE
jgi:hypothetical protein